MLPPLNPRVLDAFVGDLDDLDDLKYQFVGQAKSSLNIFRNLSWGTQFLLWTHGEFQARLYDDRSTMKNDGRGATEWHIRFRDPPFDHLFIHPAIVEGAIELRVYNQPFLSLRIFDQPQNWQVLHQWLWKWGDERQIARSIPQLDPQRIHALVNEKEISGRDGQIHGESLAESRTDDDDLSVLAARTALARGDVGEGIYKMLLVFQIFKLSLHWNPTSEVDTNMKSGLWYIIFLVSPFRSLRLQPSSLEGLIDIYAFDKRVKSLPITENPQSWQALLEYVWKYGNERHIAKVEYKASRPQSGTKAKSKRKRKVAQQPLLHQVLRTTSFKNEQPSSLKSRQLENVSALAAKAVIMPAQRSPLRLVNPNGQTGKPEQSMRTTAGNGTKLMS